jgi:Aldehyde dehydrogenase family
MKNFNRFLFIDNPYFNRFIYSFICTIYHFSFLLSLFLSSFVPLPILFPSLPPLTLLLLSHSSYTLSPVFPLYYQESKGPGFFIPPTIIIDMPTTSRIWKEEIFGPVLCIRVSTYVHMYVHLWREYVHLCVRVCYVVH